MLSVYLSDQAAAPHWGKNALLSYAGDSATIHLGEEPRDHLRRIQQAARRLDGLSVGDITLVGEHWSVQRQWAFAKGVSSPGREATLSWTGSDADQAELNARYQASEWVRQITNATPEDISPMVLASSAADFLHNLAPEHIRYSLLVGDELKEAGLVGIHGVGRGSERPPVLLELDYNPTGSDDAPVAAALVGKGITFDSGGYSIKPSAGMVTMKCDMGGAAMVTGGLALAIQRGLKVRVKLFLCCAENLISGHAYKLGDILTYRNGVSVEVVNTDAEGRLALADGLILAGETGAPFILDAATLTGAAMVAVGSDYNALMSPDDDLLHQVLGWANEEQEPAWPLPLESWHQDACPSPYADTANSRAIKGGGFGGASNAAGFLSRFVSNDGQGWVHMDLSAAFNDNANSLWGAGASAQGICTIARTLQTRT